MRCFVGAVTTPTADTPGTLLYLHFDDRRYLIGNLCEGSTRASSEANVTLRKVSDILITGRSRWSNTGGLLGMILGLADTKAATKDAARQNMERKMGQEEAKRAMAMKGADRINIFGPPNLNHLFAASRRFIFRKGLPMHTKEFPASRRTRLTDSDHIPPSYSDAHIKVWALPVMPSMSAPSETSSQQSPGRKRSHEEANTVPTVSVPNGAKPPLPRSDSEELRDNIVNQMFNSTWRYDRLVEKKLADVRMPAVCYLKDPNTKQLVVYSGPKPGTGRTVPDINVFVREPWPSSQTTDLPPTRYAQESLCYIISNHPQRGKFNPNKAKALNIPKEQWKVLTQGDSTENEEGAMITPEMVLEPGKPGNSCAVIDLPDCGYIADLLTRPEWSNDEVVRGLVMMIWTLGPGVGADERIKQFQERFPNVQHFVSSPDYDENAIALNGAATNTLRHNHVDAEIFPRLHASELTEADSAKVKQLSIDLPLSKRLQRGQQLTLEPNFKNEEAFIMPPLDVPIVNEKVHREFALFPELEEGLTASPSQEDLDDWHDTLGLYGDVEVTVLGTGSSHPSKYRNVSGHLVRVPGWGSLLLDAGEGTLNTLRRMFPKDQLDDILADLKLIWVSHLHADHHLGVTSIIKAWNRVRKEREATANPDKSPSAMDVDLPAQARKQAQRHKLAILSHQAMASWLHEYASVEDLSLSHLLTLATNPLTPKEATHLDSNTTPEIQNTDISHMTSATDRSAPSTTQHLQTLNLTRLNTVYVNHCHGAQALSLTFPNGFKLSYSGDCRPSAPFTLIGRNSHLLIHEATFEDEMRVEAIAKKHSTAGEALIVAAEMQAKVCMLTHFSQRYPAMPPLGVDIAATNGDYAAAKRLDMGNVLEAVEGEQPEANMGETSTTTGDAGADAVAAVSTTPRTASTTQSNGVDGQKPSSTVGREARREHLMQKKGITISEAQVIDQNDVQRLIDQTGLKVVFAFDYMRLKLDNVPRLLLRQPVLRAMYDKGIGKDLVVEDKEGQGGTVDGEVKTKAGAEGGTIGELKGQEKAAAKQDSRAERKRVKAEEVEKQREEAKERKRRKSGAGDGGVKADVVR